MDEEEDKEEEKEEKEEKKDQSNTQQEVCLPLSVGFGSAQSTVSVLTAVSLDLLPRPV